MKRKSEIVMPSNPRKRSKHCNVKLPHTVVTRLAQLGRKHGVLDGDTTIEDSLIDIIKDKFEDKLWESWCVAIRDAMNREIAGGDRRKIKRNNAQRLRRAKERYFNNKANEVDVRAEEEEEITNNGNEVDVSRAEEEEDGMRYTEDEMNRLMEEDTDEECNNFETRSSALVLSQRDVISKNVEPEVIEIDVESNGSFSEDSEYQSQPNGSDHSDEDTPNSDSNSSLQYGSFETVIVEPQNVTNMVSILDVNDLDSNTAEEISCHQEYVKVRDLDTELMEFRLVELLKENTTLRIMLEGGMVNQDGIILYLPQPGDIEREIIPEIGDIERQAILMCITELMKENAALRIMSYTSMV